MISSGPKSLSMEDVKTAILAARAAYGSSQFVLVGRASLAVTLPDSHGDLRATMDIDLYPPWDPEMAAKWAAADSHIGRVSEFRSTHGFYVERVAEWTTEMLPPGWETRSTSFYVEDVHVLAIHPMDLIYAKLRAGRQKDLLFVRKVMDLKICLFQDIRTFIESHASSQQLTEELSARLESSMNAIEDEDD